ncbi:TRMT2A isoform 9, partial [Pongo abelii]
EHTRSRGALHSHPGLGPAGCGEHGAGRVLWHWHHWPGPGPEGKEGHWGRAMPRGRGGRPGERPGQCLCRAPSNRVKGIPFRPVKAVAVDLFPQTPHCEMLILFERVEHPNGTGVLGPHSPPAQPTPGPPDDTPQETGAFPS